MEIFINLNSIEIIIKMYEEVNCKFKLINYIGFDKKKICVFLLLGKLGKIEIYIKKLIVRLVLMNKSIFEEKVLIDYISGKGFLICVFLYIVILKIKCDIFENLLEYIN